MPDRFDYEAAREDMWDAGLDPDDLPEKSPEKRDAYLKRVGMNPDRYKPPKKYHPGDSGSTGGTSSGTAGCFLTTACVAARNLPDDCEELNTLRAFRDGYLMSRASGPEEIREYYEIAPQIVSRINLLPTASQIWQDLYEQVISPAVGLIKQGKLDLAYSLYKQCVLELKKKCCL